MLKVERLNSGYGKLRILFDVNIDCGPKEIIGIFGPNGSGKTTFLNSVFGTADIVSGRITIDQLDTTNFAAHAISHIGVSYLLQVLNVFANLSVRENLKVSASYAKMKEPKKAIADIYEIFPILRDFEERKASTLSGGERQMLAIGNSLIRKPKLLLLDEPSTGLGPIYVNMIAEKVSQIRKDRGMSIVLVEQNVTKALEIVDRLYVIASGKVAFAGDPSELVEEKEIMKLYLGMG